MRERRAPVVALALLCAVLLAGSVFALWQQTVLFDEVTTSVTFTGPDDPVYIAYQARWAVIQVAIQLAPALAIGAVLALAGLLGTLAVRWQRREAAAQDVGRTAS